MSNLSNDLDRFLRTDGIRILIESGAIRSEPDEPLTEDDTDNPEGQPNPIPRQEPRQ